MPWPGIAKRHNFEKSWSRELPWPTQAVKVAPNAFALRLRGTANLNCNCSWQLSVVAQVYPRQQEQNRSQRNPRANSNTRLFTAPVGNNTSCTTRRIRCPATKARLQQYQLLRDVTGKRTTRLRRVRENIYNNYIFTHPGLFC